MDTGRKLSVYRSRGVLHSGRRTGDIAVTALSEGTFQGGKPLTNLRPSRMSWEAEQGRQHGGDDGPFSPRRVRPGAG